MSRCFPVDSFANIGRAFRHRNYRLFFGGQLISLIGTWMQTVALSWLVYRLSGSATLLGLMGFASQGPVLLLAQIGGAVADRYDRWHLLVLTQIAAMILASILAALTLSGAVHVWEIFTLAILLGTVNAFDFPIRHAFLVEMVGREDLQNAIALNSLMFNSARLIGPAVAGVTIAALGEGWCFLVNALSYIAVVAGLIAMHRPFSPPSQTNQPMLAQIRQGLAFVVSTRPILGILLLLGIMSLFGTPYSVLMPIFVSRILGGGAADLGILMSAVGLGALIGALVLANRTELAGTEKRIGWAIIGFGTMLILFAASHKMWLSALLLVAVGFNQMTHMASSNTIIQAMVPDAYRGRVMALYSMMFIGMVPVGALMSGFLASTIGAPYTVMLGATICIGCGTVFVRGLPKTRTEIERLIAIRDA